MRRPRGAMTFQAGPRRSSLRESLARTGSDHRVSPTRLKAVRRAPIIGGVTRGLVSVLLTLGLATAGATAAMAQQPGSSGTQDLGRLMTQTAERGTLMPVKGKHHLALKLRGVAPQVVWFDDRPARRTGQIPVGRFVHDWEGFGFEEVPPNAALTLLNAADDEDTVVLKLGAPHYKKTTRTVRYPAKLLHRATGNLSHLERQRDDHVPRHFTAASLFIDDAGYGLPSRVASRACPTSPVPTRARRISPWTQW